MLYLPQFKTVQNLTNEFIKAGVKIEYGWELMETREKEHQDESFTGDSSSSSLVETTIRRATEGMNKRANESTILGTIDLQDEDNDKQHEYETIRSQDLVAADGTRSAIRHRINMPFHGRTRNVSIIVLDGVLEANPSPEKFRYLCCSM